MKMWQKVAIGAAVVVVGAGIVLYSVNQANKGVTTVQTAKVGKQDTLVSLVTASGEIKPTTYTNVQAQGFGRITDILVREGDRNQKGRPFAPSGKRPGQRRRSGASGCHELFRVRHPRGGCQL